MSDISPAAAIGLPEASTFDRRSFLATLAAAGVMSGTADAGIVATPQRAVNHPDEKLLKLVAALFAAEAQWSEIDARADEAGIFDRCDALEPEVPSVLFFQQDRDTFEICNDRSRLAWTDGDGDVSERRRFYAEERHVPRLRWKIAKWREHGTGGAALARAEEIIAALDPYMAAVKQAKDLSGVTAFHEENHRNQTLIDDLVKQITALPALTVDGVAAKARAAAITKWASKPSYLADEMLPAILRGDDTFYAPIMARPEFVIALSVVVDAMKLGAPQPSSTPEVA